ncbi:MAG TPA: PA14 domain-containing protein, partial [Verrucomicrobiae bacterium]|nr:PA14 domain-containing protein [Verrucomicrobiae bacterium]
MRIFSPWLAWFCSCAAFSLVLVSPVAARGQMVDLNHNGMSDIWELIYGASALDPNGDADGDGATNLHEATAGTNPFDSNSVPVIAASAVAGTNLSVTIACAPGKQYQLQSADISGIGGTNWTTESSAIARSGTVLSLSAATSTTTRFYRIAISDVDTDGDGVNDWEEYQVGLDPMRPSSNGQLDSNGNPMGDYAYVTGRLAVQNQITITAPDPTANQPDPGQSALNLGALTITRGGFPLNAITVNLALLNSGAATAVEGVDHAPLPRSVSFPVGTSSQTITVTPLPNTNLLAPVVAGLQVLPGSGYKVGSTSAASVLIYPSASAAGTGLTAQYFTNSSSTYSSPANFNPTNLVLSQVDPVIDFTWGTATTPFTNSGYYTVRWTGQVQPQYSEPYTFDARTDDGVRLWVNDQLLIDHWAAQSATDLTGTIPLQGGVRYNIKMEYLNLGGAAQAHLFWYSPSQPEQVIPPNRLYPAASAPAPSAVTSPLTAVAFLGQPFSYSVTAANSPGWYSAT